MVIDGCNSPTPGNALTITIEVPQALNGERLDRALPELVPGLSRRGARERILDGSVFIDGRRIRVQSRPLRAGQRLEVRAAPTSRGEPTGTEAVCPRFSREGDLLIVEKPSGMFTEPTREASTGSLTHALKQALLQSDKVAPRFLAAVHRLDRETSGVVLIATDPALAKDLGAQLAAATVERRYLALVEGRPEADHATLDAPIARSRGRDGRYALGPGGRRAVTEVTVLSAAHDTALLEIRPQTGRSHQIRAHLAGAGHPILGDVRYGAAAREPGAFGLHSLSLAVDRAARRTVYAADPPSAFYDLASSCGIDTQVLDDAVATARAAARTPSTTDT